MSKRAGIQLAYPFEEKRLAKWHPPYIVQPKYDGKRCRAVPSNSGRYTLFSSEENPIISVPHIIRSLSTYNLNLELDGELYCHGMPFEDINSIVSRTKSLHDQSERIRFHIFDIISSDSQLERLVKLRNLENYVGLELMIAPFWLCYSLDDLMKVYDRLINTGYEGIIVRHLQAPYVRKRSVYMMKFKPKKDDIYRIVGYKEEFDKHGVPKDRFGAFICETDGNTFSVGSGLDADLREILWEDPESLIGKNLRVAYQNLTSGKKVPRFPVYLEVLDEEPPDQP